MDVEYSNINNIIGENSKNLVNDSRTFNQWTGKHTDSCEYKQLLNLSTKPMQYYVNSLNNISGTNDPYLSFTPIGNAKGEYISNEFERPIPSTLQRTSAVYHQPYSTSPFLGSQNNVNVLNTDNDLSLKTGLSLRNKNNQAELSSVQWPYFGSVHANTIGPTVQNAGQYWDNKLPNTINTSIPGLNVQQNDMSKGVGVVNLEAGVNYWASSTNMLLNYQSGPYKSQ